MTRGIFLSERESCGPQTSSVTSAAVLFGLACVWAASTMAADQSVPLDSPPGITIQQLDAGRGRGFRQEVKSLVYADANGMTLYTSSADEKGGSRCAGDCAKLWIPVKASTKAPSSDWTVIRRSDGSKQWALFGRPLYTYAKDSKIGGAVGASAENKGWQVARYQVAKVPLPAQISVREVSDLFAQVLVDWEGRTLYEFLGSNPDKDYSACHAGKEDCGVHWTPVAAPALAPRVGGFTVLRRPDGTAQWAYEGHGLYTYDRDVIPGLAEGRNADPMFRPAMIRRTFIPVDVEVREYPGITPILTTAKGMTLYRRVPPILLYNHALYLLGSSPYNSAAGYTLGLKGCDSACEKFWTPLRASPGAQSTGYWYLVKRFDGSSVWSYKGFVLYTYSKDRAPGEYSGDGEVELMISDDPNVEDRPPPSARGGALSWIRAETW